MKEGGDSGQRCNPSVKGSNNTNEPISPSLEKRGKGRFLNIIIKSPFIPLCQRGIKTTETEGLLRDFFGLVGVIKE